MKGSLVGNSIL